MKLRTRRIQKLIEAHPGVHTRAVCIYWNIYMVYSKQDTNRRLLHLGVLLLHLFLFHCRCCVQILQLKHMATHYCNVLQVAHACERILVASLGSAQIISGLNYQLSSTAQHYHKMVRTTTDLEKVVL